MKLVHPDFETPKELNQLEIYQDEGVYCLIPKDKKDKLSYFLNSFDNYRTQTNQKITDSNLYSNLPFSINDNSWKSKQKDIYIVDKICGTRKELRILDIGGWNGWLSNYLTMKGHTSVTTDIFIDRFDGLKAVNHYNNPFVALQLLPNEIWRVQESFDLIIFNRNWAYLENHQEILSMAKSKLNKNGTILFTGLTFYKNSSKIEKQISESSDYFEKKYGIPLLYFKTKGFLNNVDLAFLKNETTLFPYNVLKTLLKRLFLSKKNHQFAIYRQNET
ncbi:methyltransferase domain-containing protein [uncultured Flavobacterium sp.]|uniref:methyltransferase domain-containing protein n=1 Tax=uncultured Flavobacterium sp. TaxID=165435 RepID=UPI0030ED72D1